MGGPMVERLLAAGHPVHLHARRPEVRARFAALGATVTDDPHAAVRPAAVVLVCLYSDAQLREVALTGGLVSSMSPGSVLAVHVTADPATVTDLVDAGRSRGVEVVDAPVSGTAADIRGGRLTVLLGGEGPAADRVAGVVAAYAGQVVRTGPVGSAQQVKLLNNVVFTAHVQLLLEAVAAAESMGVPATVLSRAFAACSARSAAAEGVCAVGPVEYARRVAPFLEKDLRTAAATASALGVDLSRLLAATRLGPLDLRPGTTAST
ncbi:hypothetical protein BJF78_00890 [Pseudonocardia sp. CNS-139]|nr:hypothetical protein BJF78_00890 [Pseudonocardia sp. CNS-139]